MASFCSVAPSRPSSARHSHVAKSPCERRLANHACMKSRRVFSSSGRFVSTPSPPCQFRIQEVQHIYRIWVFLQTEDRHFPRTMKPGDTYRAKLENRTVGKMLDRPNRARILSLTDCALQPARPKRHQRQTRRGASEGERPNHARMKSRRRQRKRARRPDPPSAFMMRYEERERRCLMRRHFVQEGGSTLREASYPRKRFSKRSVLPK